MNIFFKIKNYFFYFFICSPLLVFLIILSPLKLIRFYRFNYRVGHFSEDFFLYLCKKKQENINSLDLFYVDETDGDINSGLKSLAKINGIIFLPKFIVSNLYFYIKILSTKIKYLKIFLAYERNSKKDGYQFFNKDLKLLIPHKVIEKGEEFFKKINPKNKKIICLNLWNSAHLSKSKNLDWSHHDFRNSIFENYIETINFLTNEDFLVIKIGRSDKETIIKDNPYFIDYSYHYADDYLDIAIINKCYAYISNATGLDYLTFSLNKPMLINSSHIHDFFIERSNVIYLLRPYFSNINNKFLTLKEITTDFNLSFIFKNKEFGQKNIQIKNNDAREILLATKDLLSLIRNEFVISKDLKNYSDKFFNYFMIAKEKHNKDINYYRNTNIKSFYSWSAIKENINWIE